MLHAGALKKSIPLAVAGSRNSSVFPAWASSDTIARTRASFEPLYGRPLTDDELGEILTNMGNLFRVLAGDAAAGPSKRSPYGLFRS